MFHKKTIRFMPLLMCLFLAACAGATYEDSQFSSAPDGAAAMPMEAPMPVDDRDIVGAEEVAFTANEAGELADVPNQQERLIIRTANLSLIVTNTEEALAKIGQMAEQNGGWVVSSNVYQYNDEAKSGDITFRIPTSGFNGALEAVRSLAVEVENENVSGQDVTEEYVDLDARLGNLEATADRVRGFLEETETVEEALAVNQELSRLEGEIEVIKGRMQYLSQSAAFSTITVSLMPDIVAQPVQIGGWRPQGIAKEAIEALLGTLQALATFAIWLIIYIVPVALIIGIPLWLMVRFIWRRWRQRRENRTAPSASSTD